jgi:hypothetical protein
MLINHLSLLIQAGDSKSSKEFRAEARYSEVFRRPLNSELDGKYSSRIVRSLGSTSGDIVGSKQRMDRINKIDKILGDGRLDMNDDQLTEKIIACAFQGAQCFGSRFLGEGLRKRNAN